MTFKQWLRNLFGRSSEADSESARATAELQIRTPEASPPPEPIAEPAAAPAPAATPAKPAAQAAKAAKPAAATRPKCAAITASGAQCSRSAREGSDYCGLHKSGTVAPAKKPDAKTDSKAKAAPKAAAKPAAKPAAKSPKAAETKLQPQCGALTAAGDQCKNSAREGSKYCGSHKGYRPPAKAVAAKAKDTAPRVAKAEDTKPTAKKAPAAKPKELRPQCAALSASGDQCKNSAREGSKYCGSHKGYRPPSKTTALQAKDTKPKVAKAADTAPSGRRTQVAYKDYKLYRQGNRFFFTKKARKDVAEGSEPVYDIPDGRTVVTTANGLPVLKKA